MLRKVYVYIYKNRMKAIKPDWKHTKYEKRCGVMGKFVFFYSIFLFPSKIFPQIFLQWT